MIYKEEIRDLFAVDDSYYLMQCISADFAMGAGIAVEFNKRFNTRTELMGRFKGDSISLWDSGIHGYNILQGRVLNLITKRNYWEKPTYDTLRNALNQAKTCCQIHRINKIALPTIGCGLDKLDWNNVKEMIKEIFEDTDVAIEVYYL